MQISVIVPVYNVEKFLNRCIDSILNQSFQDFELILIDDGSTDRSAVICDEYQKSDGRIRVIHQQNSGQAAARNAGIQVAGSEWIHFVDSDDFIHPQMLEYLWCAIQETGAQLSVAQILEKEECPEGFLDSHVYCGIIHQIDEYKMIDFQLHTYINSTPVAKLIRRDVLLKYPFTEGRYYEDSAVVHKWIYDAEIIVEIPLKLYFYQKNNSSTTNGVFSVKKLDALWAMEEQLKFYYKVGYYGMYNMLRTHYFGMFAELYSLAVEYKIPKKKVIDIVIHAWGVWLQCVRSHCQKGLTFKGMVRITIQGLKGRSR